MPGWSSQVPLLGWQITSVTTSEQIHILGIEDLPKHAKEGRKEHCGDESSKGHIQGYGHHGDHKESCAIKYISLLLLLRLIIATRM